MKQGERGKWTYRAKMELAGADPGVVQVVWSNPLK